MKRFISRITVVALALGSIVAFGVTTVSAADTPTVAITGGDQVPYLTGSSIITATASVPGSVSFTAIGLVIPGCDAVATSVDAPFRAKCTWTPSAGGSASLGATFTPTDATNYTKATAARYIVKIGVPTQGISSPITIYVDTSLGLGSAGALKPQLGGYGGLSSNFMLGQMINFHAYANDAMRGGEGLTPLNTVSAMLTVEGLATPIPFTYGNHNGYAYWNAKLRTGTAPGLYKTLGLIRFTVTFIAKDSESIKVLSTKFMALKKNGKNVRDKNGKTVYEHVAYYKTVKVSPAVKGATGTFESNMFPVLSQVTLWGVPAS